MFERLFAYLPKVYEKYKEPLDFTILDKLKEAYTTQINSIKSDKLKGTDAVAYPLQMIHISQDSVNYHTEKKDDRMEHNFQLIKKTIEYAKKNKWPIPTTTLHIWVSDYHPYYIPDIEQSFPIITYLSPRDRDYIIIPDNTYTCLQIYKKYKGDCKDFDYTKALIIKNQIPNLKNKVNKIYFKGASTTSRQSRLREDLHEISTKTGKKFFDVNLDAFTQYEPLYRWSKYKYLLNLPGRYPWSNRLQWLFLMKSVVINVDTYTIGIDYVYEPYNIFINLIVEPNIDYINVRTDYNNRLRPAHKPSQELIRKQQAEHERLYETIITKAKEMTDVQYTSMVESAYNKVSNLNNEIIYKYMYKLIVENSRIVKF